MTMWHVEIMQQHPCILMVYIAIKALYYMYKLCTFQFSRLYF